MAERAPSRPAPSWATFAITAVLLAAGVAGAGCGGGDDPTPRAAGVPGLIERGLGFKIGEPLVYEAELVGADKPYELTLTVRGVECSREPIEQGPDQPPIVSELGQYCQVDIAVENSGPVPAAFGGVASVMIDREGREFPLDGRASFHASRTLGSFFNDPLEPHETTQGFMVFSLPLDADPVAMQLATALATPPSLVNLTA